ncbi:MAG: nucleotide exchange factor GrpE [Bacillota bacterium]|nr:nucleotide exchange factor GrpE [Bacillota bacterium]
MTAKKENRVSKEAVKAAAKTEDLKNKKRKGNKVKAEDRENKKEKNRELEETEKVKAVSEETGKKAVREEDVPSGPEQEIDDLRQKNEELLDQLKRKQADIDNLRRIARAEQAEMRDYALHDFLCRLLPVLDNLERGLNSAREDKAVPASYVEGLEMIHKQMLQLLEQEGVSEIEAVGTPFDPNCHHAVMQVESDAEEPGTVLEELQKGYKHRTRILRPSMVKVCRD